MANGRKRLVYMVDGWDFNACWPKSLMTVTKFYDGVYREREMKQAKRDGLYIVLIDGFRGF